MAVKDIWLLLLLTLSSSSVSYANEDDLLLWNRNFDTAPVNEVLALALSKTVDLFPSRSIVRTSPLEQGEAIDALLAGRKGIHVMSMASSSDHDRRFYTIRFPVLKGLLGNRVCLIRKGTQSLFNGISTAHDFTNKGIRVCQGEHWPDSKVLKRNGFELVTSLEYQNLYVLLKEDQCDCFMRSVQEVIPELALHEDGLALERGLLIRYPQPGFFYVPKSNPQLATRIELGLLRALDDGSFQALFHRLMAGNINQVGLQNRIEIRLNNPYESAVNMDAQKIDAFWYSK